MERIWGPVNGFYLAAYAAPASQGDRFTSYAKVCWKRPESYWDAECAFKIFGGENHRSEEAALASIALEATNEISCLPSHARRFVERRRGRRLTIPRLFFHSFLRHRTA